MNSMIPIFLSLVLFSCAHKKGNPQKQDVAKPTTVLFQEQNDSLVLKKYVGGEPFMNRIDTEIEVAKNWGFIIQYTFGDCGGTYDNLIEKFKKENKKTKLALANKFGENWEAIFQDQVTFNLHPWYLNIESTDDFIKSDTLKLSTQKSKATLRFNPDKKYTLTVETNNSKEVVASYYDLSENQLHLIFPNGNKRVYNYSIKQYEIELTRSK